MPPANAPKTTPKPRTSTTLDSGPSVSVVAPSTVPVTPDIGAAAPPKPTAIRVPKLSQAALDIARVDLPSRGLLLKALRTFDETDVLIIDKRFDAIGGGRWRCTVTLAHRALAGQRCEQIASGLRVMFKGCQPVITQSDPVADAGTPAYVAISMNCKPPRKFAHTRMRRA